jgi:hypothetical protein
MPPYNRGVPSEARHPRDGAASSPEGEQGPRSTGPRLLNAWNALDRDRRLAAVAALLLFVTMLLPWYQQNAIVSASKTAPLVSQNLSAFAVFSFVEAAVLLVAVAVLVLLYTRADGRTFHLPGGDGGVIFAAGLWAALLLVLRLFDKPGITHNGVAANVGIQWGIFFALAAAGLLAYAGSRMRAAQRPEPPLLRREHSPPRAASPPPRPRGAGARRERRAPEDEQTVVIHHERAPYPAATAEDRPPRPPAPGEGPVRTATQRATSPPRAAEQLSFEDTPPSE